MILIDSKTIIILDSSKTCISDYKPYFQRLALAAILHILFRQSKVVVKSFLNNWKFILPKNTPKQKNGYDCGPMICWYSYKIITSLIGIPFNQKFKEQIAKVIGAKFDDYKDESLMSDKEEVPQKYQKFTQINSYEILKINQKSIKRDISYHQIEEFF